MAQRKICMVLMAQAVGREGRVQGRPVGEKIVFSICLYSPYNSLSGRVRAMEWPDWTRAGVHPALFPDSQFHQSQRKRQETP